MTADEAIKIVDSKANGRTRYEGQEPFLDEVLVAEIRRLRKENAELELDLCDARGMLDWIDSTGQDI